MRRISILGSTGSIGVSTLRLLEETGIPGRDYVIEALVGGRNVELLVEQALKFRPAVTVLADSSQWAVFQELIGDAGLDIACGDDAVCAAAGRSADWIMAAIVAHVVYDVIVFSIIALTSVQLSPLDRALRNVFARM